MGLTFPAFVGEKHNKLEVIYCYGGGKVTCLCTCGKLTDPISIGNLRSGNTKSCGCYKGIKNKENSKHGLASNPVYSTWVGMVARCVNPKDRYYDHYGKIGVKVCCFLESSPANLYSILGERPKAKPTIDRFPNHKGFYTCGKCWECTQNGWELNIRWASKREQVLNRGDYNHYLTAYGKTQTISQWRDETRIGFMTLLGRTKIGWSGEKVVSTPDTKGNCYKPE